MKLQLTIEMVIIVLAIIISCVIVIMFIYTFFVSAQQTIQSTNLYEIQNIAYSKTGTFNGLGTTLGTASISLYSFKQPEVSGIYLIESVLNSSASSSTTCPAYIQYKGFPKTGITCIYLENLVSTLPNGNDEYILNYNNVEYNTSSYTTTLDSVGSYIQYVVFNINGKYSYEKLTPEIQLQLS